MKDYDPPRIWILSEEPKGSKKFVGRMLCTCHMSSTGSKCGIHINQIKTQIKEEK